MFLLIISLFLNILGIQSGLPQNGSADQVVDTVLKMAERTSLDPDDFLYPSFHIYTMAAILSPYFLYSVATYGSETILKDTSIRLAIVSNSIWVGRIVSAIYGMFLIGAIYFLALNIFDKKTALLSAIFATFTMGFVNLAHFATPDIPMMFWCTLSLIFCVKIYKKANTKSYVLAGVFAGIATGIKYYAIFLFIPIIIAHLMNYIGHTIEIKRAFNKKISLSLLLIPIIFLITTPFSIINHPRFLEHISKLFNTRSSSSWGIDPNAWLTHIFNLDNAMGTPLFIVAILGSCYALYYAAANIKRDKANWILFSWVLMFILMLVSWKIAPMRNIMPIVPVLLIFGAKFLTDLAANKRLKTIMIIIIFLIVAYSAIYAIYTDTLFINDSRHLAAEWVNENIPTSEKIQTFSVDVYVPRLPHHNVNRINFEHISSEEELLENIKNYGPDYIITSSLYYDRFLNYYMDYPRRALPFANALKEPASALPFADSFYKKLFDNKLNYRIIKTFPEKRLKVPAPEFVNPYIEIWQKVT